MVRAEIPLENDLSVSYFEAEVIWTTLEDTINVGLMAKDNNTKQYLGKCNNSIGYCKGEVFLSKKKVLNLRDRWE